MENKQINVVFYSNKNMATADIVRKQFLKLNCEVIYCINMVELIKTLTMESGLIVIIDSSYKNQLVTIKELMPTKLLNHNVVAYIGDKTDLTCDFSQYKNFFVSESNELGCKFGGMCNCLELIKNVDMNKIDYNQLSCAISEYLMKLGFSHKLVGFAYLKTIVELVVKNNFSVYSLNKTIYPLVALRHHTNYLNVERSVRNAINRAYAVTKFKVDGFGEFDNVAPTNKTFITCLLDNVETNIDAFIVA